MTDLKILIGKNIAELRAKNSITQLQLAEMLNYSDKAVSKWERGESVPDITVLKTIADNFGVTLEYFTEEKHSEKSYDTLTAEARKQRSRNRGIITGLSVLLVWLIAVLAFMLADTITHHKMYLWLPLMYAVPVSILVWLIFNSIWFKRKNNFVIITLLMWTTLASAFFTLLYFGFNFWSIFILGVPGQAIIILWSQFKYK